MSTSARRLKSFSGILLGDTSPKYKPPVDLVPEADQLLLLLPNAQQCLLPQYFDKEQVGFDSNHSKFGLIIDQNWFKRCCATKYKMLLEQIGILRETATLMPREDSCTSYIKVNRSFSPRKCVSQ